MVTTKEKTLENLGLGHVKLMDGIRTGGIHQNKEKAVQQKTSKNYK